MEITRHGVIRDEALMLKADERAQWQGDDWPRPNPGPDPKSVAILGFAGTHLLAPFGEEGWELWGLNDPVEYPGIPSRRAFTRWFQIHPPHYLKKHYPKGLLDLAEHWGEETGIPVYMDRHYDVYPDSVAYPRDEVEALAPHGWFHASSFDWMVGLAILEGFERIDLYGCSFVHYPIMNGEPVSALGCLQYWIGIAEGRGIDVRVHGGGHMFRVIHVAAYQSKLQYGYEREPALDLGTDSDPGWEDVR